MERNKAVKSLVILMYKITVYLLTFFLFNIIYLRKGVYGLNFNSVSFSIIFVYLLTIGLLTPIYGNFEIGSRKSKAVIYSTSIIVLFSNITTIVFLNFGPLNSNIASFSLFSFIVFLLLILSQFVLITLCSYFGNYLYFFLHAPSSTAIFDDGSDLVVSGKVKNYIDNHRKQYSVQIKETLANFSYEELENINTIFVFGSNNEFIQSLIEYSFLYSKNLYFDSKLVDVMTWKDNTAVIDDVLMVEYISKELSPSQKIIKRLIDILGSLVAIAVFSPIFLVVSILIKIDDNGPIFYTQDRVTNNNKTFKIIKFRSMKVNSGNRPAKINDSRVTRIGRVIRKFRIDEVPQFFNILFGDMSIVGPRPESEEMIHEINKSLPQFSYRLKVKAGLTGYAQIFGKYNTPPKQKLLMDLRYIETYSAFNDLKLIFQTFNIFFKTDSTQGYLEKDFDTHRNISSREIMNRGVSKK